MTDEPGRRVMKLHRHVTRTMMCVYCTRTKGWPDHFVNSMEALCLTCWLRQHPKQVEPMRAALAEYDERTVNSGSWVSAEVAPLGNGGSFVRD